MLGILQTVADTDNTVGVGDVHLRIFLVRDEIDMPAPDRLRVEVNLLTDDLDISLYTRRGIFESPGADGAHLGSKHRNRDDSHDFPSDRRFDKLDISCLGVILQFHRVRGTAGIQLNGKARGKVAAVDGAAYKNGRGIILPGKNREGIGIGIRIEVLVARSTDIDQAVYAALFHFFYFFVGEAANNHRIEPVTCGVTKVPNLTAQLQAYRRRGHTVMLDIHPHIPVIRFLHLHHLLKPLLFPPEASGAR